MQIDNIIDEMKVLKNQILELQKENNNLRKEIIFLKNNDKDNNFEVRKSVIKLYKEGTHICNYNYGIKRDQECLFCKEIINKLD